MTIKKDDKVQVMSGEDKGKTGKVTKVIPKDNMVIVEGVNVSVKHEKPRGQGQPGGRIERENPIYADKVQVICKNCNAPVRTGVEVLKDGKKVRVCKKCGKHID